MGAGLPASLALCDVGKECIIIAGGGAATPCHTAAAQLLNAGCPVTSIQKFLGHKKLNTTMVYARAYDQTVEADYYAAMGRIEQRLELAPEIGNESQPVEEVERIQLLALAEQLSIPELSDELRLEIAAQMRGLLNGGAARHESQTEACERSEWIPPPRSAALLGAEMA
jgi:Phage integrase family